MRSEPAQVVQAGDGAHERVEHALVGLLTVRGEHRVRGHVVSAGADQHQRATRQRQLRAVGGGVLAVRVDPPGDGLAALRELRGQVAGHQTEPRAVGQDLVLAVDRRDRVLEVDDRGHRGLEHDVADVRVVLRADLGRRVEHQVEMQAVADEQHMTHTALAVLGGGEPGERRRVGQADRAVRRVGGQPVGRRAVGGDVGVAPALEREQLVEQLVGGLDDLGAALLVVTLRELVVLGERVGAVERVEQRAPPGVGGVEREAGVRGRHHQLRAGDLGDLRVDPVDVDRRDARRLRCQVAEIGQQLLVVVPGARAVLGVPGVDLGLESVAFGQRRRDPRREPLLQAGQDRPELLAGELDLRKQLVLDERSQVLVDLQPGPLGRLGH